MSQHQQEDSKDLVNGREEPYDEDNRKINIQEDREDRCTGSYRQAVGLFPILVSVIW